MRLKKCSLCKTEKPLSSFNKRSTTKDGYRYRCRKCENDLYKIKYSCLYSQLDQESFVKKNYKDNKKQCFSCKEIKDISLFSKYKRTNDGLSINCRKCSIETRIEIETRLYTKENQIKFRKNYYKNNKKKCPECKEEKDISKFYISIKKKDGLNRICIKCSKKWNKDNLNKLRIYQRERRKDKAYCLKSKVSSILNGILRGRYFKSKVFEKLNFGPYDFINHMRDKFEDGMTFDNYGKWQVDHIIPFKYKKENGRYYWNHEKLKNINSKEFRKFNSLENLVPKWANENLSKCNKYIG